MAYPTYTGYTPSYQSQFNQPTYPQPQYSSIPQNPQQMNRTGIEVMYATESEATNYLVEPNRKILFIVTDKPMQIFKATDAMGISTSKRYKMEEMNNLSTETQTSEFDPKEFVKRNDLNGFVTSDALDKRISSLSDTISKQIEDVKKSIKIQEFLKGDKNNG